MAKERESVRRNGDPEGRASLGVSGPEHDLPRPEGTIRPYVICCAPRSGSTLLTQLLHASGRMGVPAEYLNERFLVAKLGARFGTLDADGRVMPNTYLRALGAHRTSSNRVFGIKVLFSQMERWVLTTVFRRILGAAQFVWLRRRDQVGQAISLFVAQQTHRWHLDTGDPLGDPSAAPIAPRYSAELIRRALGTILSEEAGWERFFAVNDVQPLVVQYEDLTADPDRVCRAICERMGVTDVGPFRLDRASSRPTASALNAEWRDRWIDDMRFRGRS